MQEQLGKLSNLYSELLKEQKQLDSAKMWARWNMYVKPDPAIILAFQQKVINTQNEIDNILIDSTNKYGDKFMFELEKFMFPDSRNKEVKA